MIDPRSYTLEHVEGMRANTKVDRQILERSIYALGLLEALVRVEAPITFKGGSSLMLLLDHPMRLSTDIDVVVPPGTDIDGYLERASTIFPFESMEEQVRRGRNGIEKRHFKFYYASPVTKRRFHIILDVVFEQCHYARIEGRPIANDLLIVDDKPVIVEMPTADCILGDKLTAFAPHTTGIPFGVGKELEVIKQMYDISTLSGSIGSFGDVQRTFEETAKVEISYRGLDIDPNEVLEDSIESAACVAGRGRYDREEYPLFLDGIRSITNHIFGERFSAERAVGHACRVLYVSSCLLAGTEPEPLSDPLEYVRADISGSRYACLSGIRKLDAMAFAHVVRSISLLNR